MKKLLFPTDFSKVSLNAYGFALEIAAKMNAEVVTLHTYLPTVTQPEIQFPFSDDALELLNLDNYREAAEMMHEIATKENHEGISVSHTLTEGFPVESIIKHAESINASAIVMGTRGSHGLASNVLGGTTTGVVEKADVPVFVVPEEYDGQPLRKMGLGVNLITIKSSYIDQVIDLSILLDLPLTCFHIDTNHSPKLIGKIDAWKESYSPKVSFKALKNHYVMDGISEFVKSNDIDLLVMTTRKHSFLANLFSVSYTKRMTLHSKVPVCVIKR